MKHVRLIRAEADGTVVLHLAATESNVDWLRARRLLKRAALGDEEARKEFERMDRTPMNEEEVVVKKTHRRKPFEFNPEVVFPRVAHYIRASGTSYITHHDLVKHLLTDPIIAAHVQEIRAGGYKHGVDDIATKMVGYFSTCWTKGVAGMEGYKAEFERGVHKHTGVAAYRTKG